MRKLLIPGLLIVGLLGPLMAATWYSFSLQRASLNESIQFEAEQVVRTLANGMVEPVWNLIPASGRPLMDSILQEEHVVSIEVQSVAQGHFLAARAGAEPGAHLITLQRDVARNGRVIGHVQVQIDADSLYAPMDAQWRRILAVFAAEVVIVVAIVLWVFRLNSRLQRASMLRETNQRLEQEIVERKQAEVQARDSRDQLSLITNNLPANISYVASDGTLRFANRTWSDWNRRSPDSVLGRPLSSVLGDEYEKVRPYIEGVLAGEQQSFETSIAFHDGTTRKLRVGYVPHVGPDGTIAGFIALSEDITEIAKAEESLRQSQKLEAIGRLTGGVAHDFNNLLAVIQGNVELLADAVGGDNWNVQALMRATGRASELTQQLLAYSRQQPLRPETFDLAALIREMSGVLTTTLGDGVEFSITAENGLWQVLADPRQVKDALVNLVSNARDAMPSGGRLSISCRNVRLDGAVTSAESEALSGDFVALSVSDDGIGMPEEVRARAFEPFFTTKDVGQGSGLGLSMVDGFARQSGGRAIIDSVVGDGTTVTLYLPRMVEARPGVKPQPADVAKRDAEVILVVEDDADVRALTVGMLTSLGYRVIDVPNAESARQILLAGEKVDLALSDVVLPGGMSGPQLIADIKPRFPDLPVVFMSGYSPDTLTADWHLPTDEDCKLLSKPFQRGQLAQTISAALAQPAQ